MIHYVKDLDTPIICGAPLDKWKATTITMDRLKVTCPDCRKRAPVQINPPPSSDSRCSSQGGCYD